MDITGTAITARGSKSKPLQWLLTVWERSFAEWRIRILLHIFFWVFLLFFWMRESLIVHIELSQNIVSTVTGIILSLVVFYPLVYIIFPLLRKKKWIKASVFFIVYYLIAIFLRSYHISLLIAGAKGTGIWFAGQDFWDDFVKNQLDPYRILTHFFSSISGLISIVYIPLTIKFLRFAYKAHQQRMLLEKENLQLELNFLKAQVNPHLLFNSLNNLQSLILHGDKERAIGLLNRLAGLLRFSLYECKGEFVTVQQEVELLQNYVAVERVRYEDDAMISLMLNGGSVNYQLPALLLMPLVENAFKYSSGIASPGIKISLTALDDSFRFSIINTYERNQGTGDGGIGIENVRKRLQLYYPDNHKLVINDRYPYFELTVTINFLQDELYSR